METLNVSGQVLFLVQIFLTNSTIPVLAPSISIYLTNSVLLDILCTVLPWVRNTGMDQD